MQDEFFFDEFIVGGIFSCGELKRKLMVIRLVCTTFLVSSVLKYMWFLCQLDDFEKIGRA